VLAQRAAFPGGNPEGRFPVVLHLTAPVTVRRRP